MKLTHCCLLGLMFCCAAAYSADESAQVKSLEQRVLELEQAAETQDIEMQRFFELTKGLNKGVKVSGFLSAALATVDVDEDVQWGNQGPDNELDWNSDSIVGLQIGFDLADNLSAVAQLVSKGGFNSAVDADWFYLKYQMNDDFDMLLGRVRPQFFMMSDYLKVGFAYPWIRPPVEVYDPIPSDVGQGLSVNYRTRLDNWRLSTYLQFLQSEDQGTVSQFDAQVLLAAVELAYNDWTLGLHRAKLKVDILLQNETLRLGSRSLEMVSRDLAILPAKDTRVESGNVSLKYDDGQWLLLGELSYFDLEGLFVDTESFYLTLGHRFGSWLPHFTYAKLYSTDDSQRASPAIAAHKVSLPAGSAEQTAVATVEALAPILWNQQNSSYALGLNYFFSPQIVGKMEVQLITDRHGTVAQFQNASTSAAVLPISPEDDDIFVYGLSLDLIF